MTGWKQSALGCAVVLVGACAGAPTPQGSAGASSEYKSYDGFLSDIAGGIVFLPCEAMEEDEMWHPSFNSSARDEVDRLAKAGVLRLPRGAYVTLHGKRSEFSRAVSPAVKLQTTREIAVDAVRFYPSKTCVLRKTRS